MQTGQPDHSLTAYGIFSVGYLEAFSRRGLWSAESKEKRLATSKTNSQNKQENMKELLLKLALQECAKRGIGRAMRSEAEALTENILKIVDKEIDELKEKIAELEHEVENLTIDLKEANDRHNS